MTTPDAKHAYTEEWHSVVGDDGLVYMLPQMREPLLIAPRYQLVDLEKMDGVNKFEACDTEKRALAAWRSFIDAMPESVKTELAKRLLGRRYER